MVQVLRFVIACALCVPQAYAEGNVWVKDSPQYVAGESFIGVFVWPNGTSSRLVQEIFSDSGGRLMQQTAVVDPQGRTVVSELLDLETQIGEGMAIRDRTRTLSTTCTRHVWYPVVQGRKYSCETVMAVSGNVVRMRRLVVYDERQDDAKGNIVGYCESREDTIDLLLTRSRICRTGDGKWVTFYGVHPMVRLNEL